MKVEVFKPVISWFEIGLDISADGIYGKVNV